MPTEAEEIEIQDGRIRHADTQASGTMALAATAVGVLGAGSGFKLGGLAEYLVPVGLILTFFFATAARLADVMKPFQPSTSTDDSAGRKRIAFTKGKWIARSLVALLGTVVVAGVDVFA